MRKTAVGLCAALCAGCAVVGDRSGTAEPRFTVLERLDAATEIRRYAPTAAVETAMGDGVDRNGAFRLLFAYIGGENDGGASLPMTAPVAERDGARIAMTAPVTAGPGDSPADARRMRFFLPEDVDAQTAPGPTDGRLSIVALAERDIATRRFSAVGGDAAVLRETAALEAAVDAAGWRIVGPVEAWFYDPPWTLPPFRRNEVAAPVALR